MFYYLLELIVWFKGSIRKWNLRLSYSSNSACLSRPSGEILVCQSLKVKTKRKPYWPYQSYRLFLTLLKWPFVVLVIRSVIEVHIDVSVWP